MLAFQANKVRATNTNQLLVKADTASTYEATSQLFCILKSFIVRCCPDSQDSEILSRHQQQIDLIQTLLTELLEMVRSGQLDSRHSADVLKLVKREMFGDYTFQLAG